MNNREAKDRLRAERDSRKLTHLQMAEALGISRASYTKIEGNGESVPKWMVAQLEDGTLFTMIDRRVQSHKVPDAINGPHRPRGSVPAAWYQARDAGQPAPCRWGCGKTLRSAEDDDRHALVCSKRRPKSKLVQTLVNALGRSES